MHADSAERSGSYTGHLRVPGEVGGGEPDDGRLSSPVRGEVRGVPAMDASAPTLPTSTSDDGFRRIEVITGVGRRRRWTDEEKAWIVAESLDPATTTSAVARRYGLH